MEEVIRSNHNIIIEDRKKLTLSGVKDVISFDDETLLLETALGRLTVKGAGLHIVNFDTASGDLFAEEKFMPRCIPPKSGAADFSHAFSGELCGKLIMLRSLSPF